MATRKTQVITHTVTALLSLLAGPKLVEMLGVICNSGV